MSECMTGSYGILVIILHRALPRRVINAVPISIPCYGERDDGAGHVGTTEKVTD